MGFVIFGKRGPLNKHRAPGVSINRHNLTVNAELARVWLKRPPGSRGKWRPRIVILWDADSRTMRIRFAEKDEVKSSYSMTTNQYRAHVALKSFLKTISFTTQGVFAATLTEDGAAFDVVLPIETGEASE